MEPSTPSLVVILTGHLPAIIGAAALLTWPLGLVLLALYRRAVRRSMGSRASSGHPGPPGETTGAEDPEGSPAAVNVAASRSGSSVAAPAAARAAAPASPDASPAASGEAASAGTLVRDLLARPWHVGRLYASATLAYAIVLTLVTTPFVEPGAPFRPVRFLLLTTLFAAPMVPVLAIVAAASRRRKLAIAGWYAIAYGSVVILGVFVSPEFSIGQGILLWGLYNAPGIGLAALCLNRRIRAVGPLVFLFLVAGLLGADAAVLLAGASTASLDLALTVGDWLALGGRGTLLGILLFGFVVMAAIGALLLLWLRRRYEAKRTSDESVAVATLMWLFVFGYSIGLAFEHPLAPLGGVAAMAAFTAVVRLGGRFASRTPGPGVKLLLLRSFSIGARGERLFDALEKHWRRVGSIHLIAGYDLATRTMEPHECLDFVAGKLSRRFIDGEEALARRLQEMDTRPDRDGRFRVNDFFCYRDTWRRVLLALVHQSDAVLMDLRGFSRRNAGCVYEIGELFKLLSLDRVLFVVDAATDAAFLDETFAAAAAAAARAGGPGIARRPQVLTCESLDSRSMAALLTALASAASPVAAESRR